MKNGNRKAIIIGALVLAIIAAIFAAIYLNNRPLPAAGQKSITIEVVDSKNGIQTFKWYQDEQG